MEDKFQISEAAIGMEFLRGLALGLSMGIPVQLGQLQRRQLFNLQAARALSWYGSDAAIRDGLAETVKRMARDLQEDAERPESVVCLIKDGDIC